MKQKQPHRIVLVSDGTGETAAQMTQAALVQFSESEYVYFTRYKNVRNEAQIEAICDDAALKRNNTSDAGSARALGEIFMASENLLSVMDRVTGLYSALKT